jgi:hypothetical protein
MTVTPRITLPWLARVAAALALAGCGATAGAQTTSQSAINFPDLGYRYIPPHIPAGITHGTALAVDLANVARIQPPAMRLASDTVLSGARWSDWGASTTTGRGIATVRICNPSCGGGYDERYPATVVFSQLKACRSYRFYESASVTLDTVKGPRPWGAFLKDPCSSGPS